MATTTALITGVLQRVGEDPDSPAFYQAFEALDALNEAQRVFALLTLCLEAVDTLDVSGSATHHLLDDFADFLLPLRVRWASTGARIRPARLEEISAATDAWIEEEGVATHYTVLGFDLLALSLVPPASSSIELTYARTPGVMTSVSSPEIPLEYHWALEDYAVYRLRMPKEGGQEGAKTLELYGNFLSAAQECAETVRKRMLGGDYDRLPYPFKEKKQDGR